MGTRPVDARPARRVRHLPEPTKAFSGDLEHRAEKWMPAFGENDAKSKI
jgi:hypothetical protein